MAFQTASDHGARVAAARVPGGAVVAGSGTGGPSLMRVTSAHRDRRSARWRAASARPRCCAASMRVVDPVDVTAIVNTGDDVVLHGLHVSPDLDTITYTLAEAINPETGWGLAGETWQAMTALDRYDGLTWFRLGDKDLATHLYRTQRLRDGLGLCAVTAEITEAWGLELRLLPVTEDRARDAGHRRGRRRDRLSGVLRRPAAQRDGDRRALRRRRGGAARPGRARRDRRRPRSC